MSHRCIVKDPPIRVYVQTLNNPVPNYGQLVTQRVPIVCIYDYLGSKYTYPARSPESKLDIKLIFDIRYADDTTIMSTVFEKPQLSTEEFQAASVGNMVQKSISPHAKSSLHRRSVLFRNAIYSRLCDKSSS